MSKKQIIILAILIFLILVLLGGMKLVFISDKNNDVSDDDEVDTDIMKTEEEIEHESGISQFTKEVDETAEETKAEIIIPIKGSETGEKEGRYTIVGSSNGYNPDILTVTENTIISLRFKAEGEKYDFSIPNLGILLKAEKGEVDQSGFRVPGVGTYRFECRDFCPSSGKIYGKLIVKPKG